MKSVESLYHSARWERMKAFIIDRDNGICQNCKRPIVGRFIIHHKQLATTANFYDPTNLELLDIECHNWITFHEGKNKTDANRTTPQLHEVTNLIDIPDD